MKLNLYVIYDKDNRQAGQIFSAMNDEQANKRLKNTIEHFEKNGMNKEMLQKSLTVLNIGAYDTNVVENTEYNNNELVIRYDSVICVDEVYDINNIPVGFIPRVSKLEEEEKSLYQRVKEELKKGE